jgi:tetratricopeptide (TPR) repeat protein
VFRLLVSAPPFAEAEWNVLDHVIDAINDRLRGLAQLEMITSLSGDAALDAMIILLRPRLEGDVDQVRTARSTRTEAVSLSEAIGRQKPNAGFPDIFIFSYARESPSNADGDWETRKRDFQAWFAAKGGDYLALETYASPAQFAALAENLLYGWLGRAGFVPPPLQTPVTVVAPVPTPSQAPAEPPSADPYPQESANLVNAADEPPKSGAAVALEPKPTGRRLSKIAPTIALSLLGLALLVAFGWRWHLAEARRDELARETAAAAAKAGDIVTQLSGKPDKNGALPAADAKALLERAEQLQNLLLDASGATSAERSAQAEAALAMATDLIRENKLADAQAAALKGRQILQSLSLAEPDNADWRDKLFSANKTLGDILAAQGHFDEAAPAYSGAVTISAALTQDIAAKPDLARQLIDGDYDIGNALLGHGRRDEAIAAYRTDVGVARAMAAKNRGDSAWSRDIALAQEGIGKALTGQDRFEEASVAYGEALSIHKSILGQGKSLEEQVSIAELDQTLGDLAMVLGHKDQALADYREGADLWKAITTDPAAGHEDDLVDSYDSFGGALAASGMTDEALDAYRNGVALANTMANKHPAEIKWRRMIVVGDTKIGDILLSRNRADDALSSYNDGLGVLNVLIKTDPENTEWKGLLSADHERIGDLFASEGHLESALESYHEELMLLQDLSRKAPDNASWSHALSECHLRIGAVFFEQGRIADAVAAHRESLGIVRTMARMAPSDAHVQHDLLMGYSKIGQLLMAEGSEAEALAAYREALTIVKNTLARDPDNNDLENTRCMIDSNIGVILTSEGRADEARDAYLDGLETAKKLSAASPQNIEWRTILMVAYYNLAEAGDDPSANFSAALAILKQLEAAGTLAADKRELIGRIEAKLAATKNQKQSVERSSKHPPTDKSKRTGPKNS